MAIRTYTLFCDAMVSVLILTKTLSTRGDATLALATARW